MNNILSSDRTVRTVTARIYEQSVRDMTVAHLRTFLAEVDRLGFEDSAAVRLRYELHPSDAHHTLDIGTSRSESAPSTKGNAS